MRPGKEAEYPLNIFNVWLDYREAQGDRRASIIREVNAKLGRKYDNNNFYRWKKQRANLPELIYTECVKPELPEALKWFFVTHEMPIRGIDFELLAEAVTPAIKMSQ